MRKEGDAGAFLNILGTAASAEKKDFIMGMSVIKYRP